MLKKKIPAVFQPDGQTMKTMKISRFNIHPCVNESMIEIRVKSGLSMKKNQFFIEKSKVSMPPFGNDIDTALMDLDKVQMFCTKLDLCGKSQKARIDGLMVDKKKLEETVKKQNDIIETQKEAILDVITFIQTIGGDKAKNAIDKIKERTKISPQISP